MHFKWNLSINRVLASSVAALLASASVYAIPKGPCDTAPDVCCQEPKPGPFAFAYPMDMALSCPRDFYFHVDGLMFQAKEDGLEFVIADSNALTAPITRGEVNGFTNDHRDWSYNPGFRVGAGFNLEHDAWCLDFNWTWLNIANYAHVNASDASEDLIPLWALGSSSPTATIGTRSSSAWHSSYDTIDINLMKPYHVSRYLVMNPFFGVRGAWIDQHYSVHYAGAAVGDDFTHHGDNEFWGVGTRAGLNSDWILGKGWCLFGNISFAMMYGKFEVEQNIKMPGTTDGFDLEYDFYQNAPNVELAVGVAWGRHFNKGRYHVGLKAGYEFIEWFDQMNMRKFFSGTTGYANDVVSRGNLTLNGFSLRLQLDI